MVKCVLLVLVIVLVASVQPALAYIDPNIGGMLFQVLVAAFAFLSGLALLFSRHIRMAFARIMRFLRSQREEPDTADEPEQFGRR